MHFNKNLKWWGWGDKSIIFDLEHHFGMKCYFKKYFNLKNVKPYRELHFEDFVIPKNNFNDDTLAKFKNEFGSDISWAKEDRLFHSRGKSYLDLIDFKNKHLNNMPDLIFYPQSTQKIERIIKFCEEEKINLMPFGGGTSVVGGVNCINSPSAILNMTKLNHLINLNHDSQTAEFEAGILGPQLEQLLNEKGFTLGHFPQSFEFSTLGGWVAAKSSGQNSIFYGGIEKLVESLEVVTPQGIIKTIESPRGAIGIDFKELFIGSEGTLGVITKVKVKIQKKPEHKEYILLIFKNYELSKNFAKNIIQNRIPVYMIRVSDPEETETLFAFGQSHENTIGSYLSQGVLGYLGIRKFKMGIQSAVLIGLEGSKEEIASVKNKVLKLESNLNYVNLGNYPGKKWLKSRFFHPYLRDELLENEILVETFETSTTWNKIDFLYNEIKQTIDTHFKSNYKLLCHISHLYTDGASLYFTFFSKMNSDPITQWFELKEKINLCIKNCGASISHHHGIGKDHKKYNYWNSTQENIFKAIKTSVDPNNILSPGNLL